MSDDMMIVAEEFRRREAELMAVAREEAEKVVRTALADVPSRTEVAQMIDAKTEEKAREFSAMVRAVDGQLRQTMTEFEPLRQMIVSFPQVVNRLEIAAATLTGRAEQIDSLDERTMRIEARSAQQDGQIAETRSGIRDLRRDFLGDPAQPDAPNFLSTFNKQIGDLSGQVTTLNQTVLHRMEAMQHRLQDVEIFVQRRRQVEAQVRSAAAGAAKAMGTTRFKVALVVIVLALLGVVEWQSIERFLQALLTGGT